MLTRSANAVDIHVGRRVRTARLAQRISQEKLAEAVGVSFQQIQKYENGVNPHRHRTAARHSQVF